MLEASWRRLLEADSPPRARSLARCTRGSAPSRGIVGRGACSSPRRESPRAAFAANPNSSCVPERPHRSLRALSPCSAPPDPPSSPTPRSAPRGLLSSGCQCERSVRCASSSSPRPPPLQCVPAHSSQCEPLLRSESSCVLLTTGLSSHTNLRAVRCCSLRCSTRAWATQPFCLRWLATCTAKLLHRPPGATCPRNHCFQRKPVAQALKHRYVPYESLQDSK